MDEYLKKITKFYEFTDEYFCSLIPDDSEKSKESLTDGHFSLRSFQALKSKKSDMLHSYHIKEILKKFSLINIDEESEIHEKATTLAEKFLKISRDTTSISLTPYNLVTQDPSWWLDKIECNDPDINIDDFKIEFNDFLVFGSFRRESQYSRPTYRYLLFLYKWLCIRFKNKKPIDYKYLKKKLSNPDDKEGQTIRDIIRLATKYSDNDIDTLSNKSLGKIASSINFSSNLWDFLEDITDSYYKDIKVCIDGLNSEDSIFDKDERDELSSSLCAFNIEKLNVSSGRASINELNQLFIKLDNMLDSQGIKNMSSKKIVNDLFSDPLNALCRECINANLFKILRDLIHAANKFHIVSLLGQYNIDTTSLISDLKENGSSYVIKKYLQSHKGYLWWKLYFDRAYNRYFFPSWMIDDSIECKMLE